MNLASTTTLHVMSCYPVEEYLAPTMSAYYNQLCLSHLYEITAKQRWSDCDIIFQIFYIGYQSPTPRKWENLL